MGKNSFVQKSILLFHLVLNDKEAKQRQWAEGRETSSDPHEPGWSISNLIDIEVCAVSEGAVCAVCTDFNDLNEVDRAWCIFCNLIRVLSLWSKICNNIETALFVFGDDVIVLPPWSVHNILWPIAHLDPNGRRLVDRVLWLHHVSDDYRVLRSLQCGHAACVGRRVVAWEWVLLCSVYDVSQLNVILWRTDAGICCDPKHTNEKLSNRTRLKQTTYLLLCRCLEWIAPRQQHPLTHGLGRGWQRLPPGGFSSKCDTY